MVQTTQPIDNNLAIQVLREHPGILSGDALQMILNAVKLLIDASGWGEITLVFKGGEAREAGIYITQRPENKGANHG